MHKTSCEQLKHHVGGAIQQKARRLLQMDYKLSEASRLQVLAHTCRATCHSASPIVMLPMAKVWINLCFQLVLNLRANLSASCLDFDLKSNLNWLDSESSFHLPKLNWSFPHPELNYCRCPLDRSRSTLHR